MVFSAIGIFFHRGVPFLRAMVFPVIWSSVQVYEDFLV